MEQECINRLAADMQTIVRTKIGIADTDTNAFIKLCEIEMLINNILKAATDDRMRVIADTQRLYEDANLQAMRNEELGAQIQARQTFLSKIIKLGNDQANIKLDDIAAAIAFIEKRKIDNQWEANAAEFAQYESHFDAAQQEIKDLLKTYYESVKNNVSRTSQQIKNNAFPTLCYIMAFLCLLPAGCRDAVIAQLHGTPLGNLARLSLSPEACMYWKANTASYMYNGVANLTPDQISEAMRTLYGVAINCRDICYALLLNFNTISSRAVARGASAAASSASSASGVAQNILYGLMSRVSDRLGLVDINLEISDTQSNASGRSVYSITTNPSAASLTVQVLAPMDSGPSSDIQQRVVDSFNEQNQASASNQNTQNEEVYDVNTGIPLTEKYDEENAEGVSTKRQASMGAFNRGRDETLGSPGLGRGAEQAIFGNRKGGRKRKSMRHRKRRSTLKRRKMKRRRTRKGKKRRHTNKRR